MHGPTSATGLRHLAHEHFNVIAHQIEFLAAAFISWMHRQLGGRKSENQPTLADIHMGKTQNVAQERAIGFGILGIDDAMCARDHDLDTPVGSVGATDRSQFCRARYFVAPIISHLRLGRFAQASGVEHREFA